MALEGVDIEVPAVGTDLPIDESSIDGDISEVTSVMTDAENVNDSIDEAVETAITFESISAQLYKSAANGGMSYESIRAVEIAVEHMCVRVGYKPRKSRFALEAYSAESAGDKVKAVGKFVADSAKALWAYVVKAAIAAYGFIKKFAEAFFASTERYAEKAEAIIARCEQVKDDTSPGKLDTNPYIEIMRDKNKPLTPEEFISKYNGYMKDDAVGIEEFAKILSFITGITGIIGKGGEYDASKVSDCFNESFDTSGGNKFTSLPFGDVGIIVSAPIGNTPAMPGPDTNPNVTNTKSYTVKIDKSTQFKDLKGAEYDALAPTQVRKLAVIVKDHMAQYASYKNKDTVFEGAVKGFIDQIKKYENRSEEESEATAKSYASLAKCAIHFANESLSQMRKYDLKVAGTALKLCAASLKIHSSAGASENA